MLEGVVSEVVEAAPVATAGFLYTFEMVAMEGVEYFDLRLFTGNSPLSLSG